MRTAVRIIRGGKEANYETPESRNMDAQSSLSESVALIESYRKQKEANNKHLRKVMVGACVFFGVIFGLPCLVSLLLSFVAFFHFGFFVIELGCLVGGCILCTMDERRSTLEENRVLDEKIQKETEKILAAPLDAEEQELNQLFNKYLPKG